MTTISMLLNGMITLLLAGAGLDPSVASAPAVAPTACSVGTDSEDYDQLDVTASYEDPNWTVTVQPMDTSKKSSGTPCTCNSEGCSYNVAPSGGSATVNWSSGSVIYFGGLTSGNTISDPPPTALSDCQTIDFGAATFSNNLVVIDDPKITIATGDCGAR